MEDLSLHILDIAENSIRASASVIKIEIAEDSNNDFLLIKITDNGKGMDEETIKRVLDPFYTTKDVRRFGLGIPLLEQTARDCEGSLDIKSELGKGTEVTVRLKRSHIDMKPLGDIGSTLITMIMTNPEVTYKLIYKNGDNAYEFDSDEVKAEIGLQGLLMPQTLEFIKDHINCGIESCKKV